MGHGFDLDASHGNASPQSSVAVAVRPLETGQVSLPVVTGADDGVLSGNTLQAISGFFDRGPGKYGATTLVASSVVWLHFGHVSLVRAHGGQHGESLRQSVATAHPRAMGRYLPLGAHL